MPEETSGWFRRRVRRRALAALLALGLVLVGSVVGVRAAPAAQPADQGRELFAQRCASCHTVGAGNLVLGASTDGLPALRDNPELTFTSDPAGPDSITRSSGSWVRDGFHPGQTVLISDTANNNKPVRIAAVTDDRLILDLSLIHI